MCSEAAASSSLALRARACAFRLSPHQACRPRGGLRGRLLCSEMGGKGVQRGTGAERAPRGGCGQQEAERARGPGLPSPPEAESALSLSEGAVPAPGASAPASVLCSPRPPPPHSGSSLQLCSCLAVGVGVGAGFLCLFFFNWVKSQIATVPGCQASPGPWFPEGSLPSSLGAPSSLRVCRDLSESVHGKG